MPDLNRRHLTGDQVCFRYNNESYVLPTELESVFPEANPASYPLDHSRKLVMHTGFEPVLLSVCSDPE